MPNFKNLDDLFDHIAFDVMEALNTEVLDVVQQTQVKKIYEEVYYTYRISGGSREEPFVYLRREDDGGLADRSNIIPMDTSVNKKNKSVSMEVVNVTKSSSHKGQSEFYLAPLVEYGDGFRGLDYTYKDNKDGTTHQYLQSRPFTYETIVELEQTNNHVQAMKNSLKKAGYKVK